MNMTAMRYPGGDFASGYHWHAIALVYIGVILFCNIVCIDKDFRICKTGHDILLCMEI
jgi:hypothetical protein